MRAILQFILSVAIPLFAIASMASVGAGNSLREVTKPFRRPTMLVTALSANFVAVPLLCVLIIRVLRVPDTYAAGLFLVSCAGGAAFLIALAQMARSDVALAGGHLLILMPATIIFMPLVVPWALPEANVNVPAIARPLVLTMLLPLGAGMLFRRWFGKLVPKVMPVLGRVSKYSLVTLIAVTVILNARGVVSLLSTPALPAALLLVLGALIIGFVASVPSHHGRVVLALGTGQRNIAASMLVASSSFESPEPLVMVVVTSLVGFAILFPAAAVFRRALEKRGKARGVRFEHEQRSPFDERQRV